MKPRLIVLAVVLLAMASVVGGYSNPSVISAQVPTPVNTPIPRSALPPPLPALYLGTITAAGQPVPDGMILVGRIGNYETPPVIIEDGRYDVLKVTPPDGSFIGKALTFHLGDVEADQRSVFQPGQAHHFFNLTFATLPEATPTPVIAPSVYSGEIVVAGGFVADGSILIAQVGNFQSPPAAIIAGAYQNLVLNPSDDSLIGQPVRFILNGVESLPPTPLQFFNPGTFSTVNLIYLSQPELTPTPIAPTETPEPPTPEPTEVPPTPAPTDTPLPPTATATNTAVPTATAVPPTATAVPPTPTQVVIRVTATSTTTAAQPEASPTPEPEGGACSLPLGHSSPIAGLGQALFLFGPVFLLGAYRYRGAYRHRRRR